MINLKDEADVQIWCDHQEETKQTSADFFLRLRFANFRTIVADVSNYSDNCNVNDYDDGFGDGYGDGNGYGFGSGNGYGDGSGNGYGDNNGNGFGYGLWLWLWLDQW